MSAVSNACFADVLSEIDMLLKSNETVIVAIDGKSGSGKSLLSGLLETEYDCNVFHMDDFFLTPELRTSERLAEAGGNIDYERFETEIIDSLMKGLDFCYEIYNCKDNTFEDSEIVRKKQLNIVEGVYSQHPRYSDFYDFKIFLFVDDDTQVRRILERNGKEVLEKYLSEWIPLENLYFESCNISKESDLFIDTSVYW